MKCEQCGGDMKLFKKDGVKVHKTTKEKFMKVWYRCVLCKRFEKIYTRVKGQYDLGMFTKE